MKNRNIGIIMGLLPVIVIILTLFIKSSTDNTSLSDNAIAQPYPYLQPFPATSQLQQQPPQQQQQPPLQQQLPNTATNVLDGNNNNNNNNNPLQNLQNQIDQLKAIISGGLHLRPKLVVTERFAPDFTKSIPGQSKAVCSSDEVVTGGGWITPEGSSGLSAQAVLKNEASGNGWLVEGGIGPSVKAVAECAKLS
jgi:hypothetical protein